MPVDTIKALTAWEDRGMGMGVGSAGIVLAALFLCYSNEANDNPKGVDGTGHATTSRAVHGTSVNGPRGRNRDPLLAGRRSGADPSRAQQPDPVPPPAVHRQREAVRVRAWLDRLDLLVEVLEEGPGPSLARQLRVPLQGGVR